MAPSSEVLVDLDGVTLAGPDRPILDGVSLTVCAGDRVGVVGLNGAGKTALLSLITRSLEPTGGAVRHRRHLRVAHLPQDPADPEGATVGEVLSADLASVALGDRLGLAPWRERSVESLSGGLRKRLALVHTLAREADLLVLDEPTNHLDLENVTWLEEHLRTARAAVVLVSHDRTLLDAVTTRLVEVDRGALHEHRGGYAAYVSDLAARTRTELEAEQVRRNAARRELAWLRRGAPARSRKPRARVEAATRLVTSRPAEPARAGALDLRAPAPRLGRQAVTLEDATVAIGDQVILRDLDLVLGPGDHIGVVGPNGAGKTILLELLVGQRAPTSGRVRHGATARATLFSQHSRDLPETETVEQVVAGASGMPGSDHDRDLLARFWFAGALARTPVRLLSGGERRRLQLLLALAERPNLLALDEPTNDLDLETIRALEDYLESWPGALVVASHDRSFLRRIASPVYRIHDDGTVREIPGGIDGWAAHAAVAPPALPPRGRALREAERRMTSLERRKQRLSDLLSEPADPADHARWARELAEVLAELAAAEDAWLAFFE